MPYLVQNRDPRRIATAVVLYQLRQPRFALTLAASLAAFAVAGSFSGTSGAVAGVAFALVVIVLVTEYKRRQLAIVLARRGFRPGSTLEASADDAGLTVNATRYPWDEVEHVLVVKRVVLFRVRSARAVVAVPAQALPGAALTRVQQHAATPRT